MSINPELVGQVKHGPRKNPFKLGVDSFDIAKADVLLLNLIWLKFELANAFLVAPVIVKSSGTALCRPPAPTQRIKRYLQFHFRPIPRKVRRSRKETAHVR